MLFMPFAFFLLCSLSWLKLIERLRSIVREMSINFQNIFLRLKISGINLIIVDFLRDFFHRNFCKIRYNRMIWWCGGFSWIFLMPSNFTRKKASTWHFLWNSRKKSCFYDILQNETKWIKKHEFLQLLIFHILFFFVCFVVRGFQKVSRCSMFKKDFFQFHKLR